MKKVKSNSIISSLMNTFSVILNAIFPSSLIPFRLSVFNEVSIPIVVGKILNVALISPNNNNQIEFLNLVNKR